MVTTRTELTSEAIRIIETKSGPILKAETVSGGFNSEIAAIVHTSEKSLFVKGLRANHRRVWTQQAEARISPYLQGVAPALLWQEESSGWNLLAFEHVQGRHAEYGAGSDDLPVIVSCMRRLQQIDCPDVPLKQAEERLRSYVDDPADASLFAGPALLHTDWNRKNLLIETGRVHLVDWAWATRGAAWIDPAGWLVWLMAEGGQTAKQAEEWAARIPSWQTAPTDAVRAYANANARLWAEIASADPDEWTSRMASAAEDWAHHRRGGSNP
ncbi:Aminoglycoside phosphotransferase [Frankia sp. Hr75.2]|nr:Aminoglycoside phosphotransferase [Frankia sp. Hr75.2]